MNIGQFPPSYLLSLHAQSLKWHVALGELCDNSFDANASRIEIVFGPRKQLQVTDDGNGCDDVERMLTLGKHYRHATTKLGRFGVGLKEAACWLWGELRIDTTHKATRRLASIDWQRLSKQEDWNVPDPTTVKSDASSGTVLTFRNVSKGFPDYSSLRDELSYTFAPALWFGKQIVMKFPSRPAITCAGWQMPDVTDMIQDRFEVRGKRVHLKVGIVPIDVTNHRPGFSVCHGHRIIMNTGWGSRGHSVARICGIIELDGSWLLSKNKTEVVDSDQELLEEEIFTRCQSLLVNAAQQAEIIRNSALESVVSESLRDLLSQKKKAKRKSAENETGAIEEKKTGKRHRRAKNTQPGERFLDQCNLGQIRMEWESRNDGQIGRVDIAGNVIYLNSDHRRLQYHRDRGNSDALVDTCMTLLSFEAIESEQRERLPFIREYEGFIDALSHVLEHQEIRGEVSQVA